MTYLKNTWYAAAWSADIAPGALFARTICDDPIVFARMDDGGLSALYDRCPHRFAALSQGKIVDGSVMCGYHGLRFDASGACVANPHGNKKIPPAATCRSYPVSEKHSIVWIWMGADEPQSDAIPDFSIFDVTAPEFVARRDYILMNASYDLITDNLLDLSHVNVLHDGLLGNDIANNAEIDVESDGATVVVRRFARDIPVPKLMDLSFRQDGRNVDFWNEMRWDAPACMLLDAGVTEPGTGKAAGTGFNATHLLTPAAGDTTHYLFSSVRVNPPKRALDDEVAIRDQVSKLRRFIFEMQDEPMIALQQQRTLQRNDGVRPALLAIDAGPVRAARILRERIEREREVERHNQPAKAATERNAVASRTIEVAADPDLIYEIISDPREIPAWATPFADAITGDPTTGWTAIRGDRTIPLRVAHSAEARTVDILREIAPGRWGGAYIRITPHPQSGSIVTMTIPVPAGAGVEETDAVLREELAGLARLAGQRATDLMLS